MRKTLCAIAALAFASPLIAQVPQGAAHDPTHAIKGSGKLPDGMLVRLDPPRGNQPAPKTEDVSVEKVGSGYHFTSGPAGIYYNPKDVGSGQFGVTATFTQTKSMNHEAYGIFIGGRNLEDSTQTYTYFVIKPCHSKCGTAGITLGEVLISQRSSNGRPVALVPLRNDPAVVTDDPKDGHATNKMTIHVAADAVHFVLNDKLVAEIPKSKLGITDGITGIRINHNMDVQVAWEGVKK
jgi:hypothetical protein